MRASCATDWAEALPAHVVAKWLGHSPLVAAKHYLQTRDAHFEEAAGGGARVEGGWPEHSVGAPVGPKSNPVSATR